MAMERPLTPNQPSAGYDLDFRPGSYFLHREAAPALLQDIKGEQRRAMARDALESGREIDPRFYGEDAPPSVQNLMERVDPRWMGGEYLPDYLPGEVEIARIVLASVTQDVVSVRARRRRSGQRILYRVVDEYETPIDFAPRSSAKPLSFGQLVTLVDSIDLGRDGGEGRTYLEETLHGMPDSTLDVMVDFVTVESLFYPGLGAHFAEVAERVAREVLGDLE